MREYINKHLAFKLLCAEILISIFSIVTIYQLPNQDIYFAYYFVSFFSISFLIIWRANGSRLSPIILFLLTVALFLGGKYIGYLLGAQSPLFSLYFFVNYEANYSDKVSITLYLTLFISLIIIGYISVLALSKKTIPLNSNFLNNNLTSSYGKRLALLVKKAFLPFSFFIIITSLLNLKKVFTEGYLSLFLSLQNEEYSTGVTGIISVLFMVFFGLAFGFCDKETQKKYLILFAIRSGFSIVMGSRGAFGTTLLILMWIYSLRRKISLKKLFMLALGAIIVLNFVFTFSIRSTDLGNDNNLSLWDLLVHFVSGQGISLMVFDVSREVDSYPVLAYFQSIIPGSSFFYTIFTSNPVASIDNNFSSYLCYNLNPSMYKSGLGLGWTLMSDFYIFGCRNIIGFSLISVLFGLLLGFITVQSHYNHWYKSLLFTITIPLLFLPRGAINSFATVIIYCMVTYILILIWAQTKHINLAIKTNSLY